MKLVIVGGVAAGASTAARARRLDERASILLFERGHHVSFANCGLPYHIGGDIRDREQLLLQTPQSLKESLNLDVRTGHEVLSIQREARTVRVRDLGTGREYDESYDKLVLCPGAQPMRPPIPGIDHPRVFVLRNIQDMDAIKAVVDQGAKRAVVIGAGYIGVEMAECLRHRKLDVDLVEMEPHVMPPLDPEMAHDLQIHLERHGVRLHRGTAAAALRDAGGQVSVELKNTTTLTADLVVLSTGVKPDAKLAKDAGLQLGPRGGIQVDPHMRTSDPNIYAAGDAVEVPHAVLGGSWLIPLAGPANRQGRVAAENVCGRSTTFSSSQGTAIVKVFDMSAGGTGATEKILRRANTPYRKIYIHPSGHAGYYPGTAPLHIKMLYAPDTGRILGAQVVGYDGVDKRLDVFAVAIRAGMTVYDLEQLELAYAPPYGSAKDPVNMAGFVASNQLRGDVEFWYAEEYPAATEGGVILDVRGAPEFDSWHIPGAVNLPLGKLRAQSASLPKDRPIFVYCKVGFRSYLAMRLLKQLGFTRVRTLAGGSTTFCALHETDLAGPVETPFLAYAEEKMAENAAPTGRVHALDCTALQCPGPIMKLKQAVDEMAIGDEVEVTASDPGFYSDAQSWTAQQGHELVALVQEGSLIKARIRKSAPRGGPAARPAGAGPGKKTMVVFSGELDKVLAAFIIANGAAAMGDRVSLFFTFWGLNALRKAQGPVPPKPFLDRMFGFLMPRGAERLKLSNLNMLGVGTEMMKHVMKTKNVNSLPELMASARQAGVRLIACTMTMDVMGIRQDELIDGVELGGVATFLGEADASGTTLFV